MSTHNLPGFSSPSASTEVPLEMLAACHGRIDRQCQTLERLCNHLARHGSDNAAREAAVAIMRYFDTAARDHHADEENDLFPALLASAGAQQTNLQTLTERLRAEHRQLEAAWQALRLQLQAIAEGNDQLDAAEATRFVASYRAHIELEDSELLPAATRCLDTEALRRIGQAMRERRGIPAID